MASSKYSKFELAENQLETAIGLFVSGGDKFSVITLAGAADVLLCQLVKNQGEESFTEFTLKNDQEALDNKHTVQQHGRNINDLFHINDLKHFDKDENETVTMDIDECALGAILKAVVNVVTLTGGKEDYIQAFIAWSKLHLDPNKYDVSWLSN